MCQVTDTRAPLEEDNWNPALCLCRTLSCGSLSSADFNLPPFTVVNRGGEVRAFMVSVTPSKSLNYR
jgi:hypothetical protein